MRYLLFGDSCTHGVGDPKHGGWAGRLRKYLDKKEKNNFFHNLSISGDTSRGLLNRMESEAKLRIRNKPKEEWMLVFSIGANDSKVQDGKPAVPEDEYRDNILKLIKIAKKLVGKVAMIGPVPVDEEKTNPFKGKYYYHNERIKSYGQILKDCAEKNKIPFVDPYPTFEKMDHKKISDDGLHPNAKGHKIIYKLVRKSLFP